MALNFGLLDPDAPAKIANSFYAGQQEQQKNMMAQQQMKAGAQQLETGRLQQQHSQMQMDQMIRDRDALAKLQQQFVANGKSPDLEVNADAMIQSGISHYVDIGFQLKQKLMDQKRYAAIMGGEPQAAPMPAAPVAAPTPAPAAPAPAAPVAEPQALITAPQALPTQIFRSEKPPTKVPVGLFNPAAQAAAAEDEAFNAAFKAKRNAASITTLAPLTPPPPPPVAAVATPINNIAPAALPPANQLAPAAAPANQLAFAPNPAAANVDVLRRQRNALLAMGTPQAIAAARALDADIAIASKEPVYHNVPGVGLTNPRTREILFAEQNKPTELQRNYEYAKEQGFKGDIFAYEKALKEAARTPGAPRPEPTPSITTIQDPTNPNQMISINARDYRGGGVGSLGVIGLTGKTPAATAKQDIIDKGNAQLSSVIDDLRASYSTLEKAAAIPSTQRGVLSNLASSAQASGIGQALGRLGGTEEQSARDTINSSRLMLLNAIKTATGMSSQQLNSNMELKSWLSAVSDPTQSIETVSKVLDNIEKFVASGGKYTAKKEGAPVAVSGKPATSSIHDQADAILRGSK